MYNIFPSRPPPYRCEYAAQGKLAEYSLLKYSHAYRVEIASYLAMTLNTPKSHDPKVIQNDPKKRQFLKFSIT
jgi:hypothetical protein